MVQSSLLPFTLVVWGAAQVWQDEVLMFNGNIACLYPSTSIYYTNEFQRNTFH